MPRRGKVPSLVQLCISSVLKNMETFWCADLARQNNFRFVVGPFDDLPVKLAQEIFKELKTRKQLRRHHVQLLLNTFFKYVVGLSNSFN